MKRTRLRCTKLHKIVHLYHPLLRVCSHVPITPMFDSSKLFEFACPMHCWTSNRSSSKRLPLQHSASPSFMGETHDVASKFPMLISAIFRPCFYVTCLNQFQMCKISCHGSLQQIELGAPTTHRIIRRKWISSLTISILTNQDAIVVKGNDVGHKWLGCILSAAAYGRSTLDTTYHLQAASRASFANKQILCDKKVRLAVRLRFFDRVITPLALFASGHGTIRMSALYKLDVVFRKMLRMIVGPPSFVEWNAPWHDILHHWNGKAIALAQHGLNV